MSTRNVYAVVHVDRNVRNRSAIDSQEDVIIMGVFTDRNDAHRYILNNSLSKNLLIHVVELDPGINNALNSSLTTNVRNK